MTDYEWAMEYKKSADVVAKMINNFKKTHSRTMSCSDEKKLQMLIGTYSDCLYSYRCLLRRCKNEVGRNNKKND